MTIDFTKLLGFDTVSHELSVGLDLRDETLGGKLGAKVGAEPESTSPARGIDFQDLDLGSQARCEDGSRNRKH